MFIYIVYIIDDIEIRRAKRVLTGSLLHVMYNPEATEVETLPRMRSMYSEIRPPLSMGGQLHRAKQPQVLHGLSLLDAYLSHVLRSWRHGLYVIISLLSFYTLNDCLYPVIFIYKITKTHAMGTIYSCTKGLVLFDSSTSSLFARHGSDFLL